MIIGTVTVTRSMVLAALAAVAFLFAVASLVATFGGGVPTPGFWAAQFLIHPSMSSMLEALTLQVAIDWLLWFALMCTVYLLIAKFLRRSGD